MEGFFNIYQQIKYGILPIGVGGLLIGMKFEIGNAIFAFAADAAKFWACTAGGLCGIGFIAGLGGFIYYRYNLNKTYKENLIKYKEKIIILFEELLEKNYLNEFECLKETFFKESNINLEIMKIKINKNLEKEWENLNKNYQNKKKDIYEKLNN